jgi:DNA (cytosine-5)-methyltransferase 1
LNAFDNTGDSRATVLIFTAQRVGEPPRIYENITPSLLSRMGTGGNNTPMVTYPIQDGRDMEKRQNGLGVGNEGDPSYTLDQTGAQAVAVATVVRRLTPVECERLMGWPDNHTLHRADGKTNSDSTRYKMCGNGVATPVARWIAEQLRPLLEP